VLGAPLSGAQYNQDDDEEMLDYDLTCKQAPSSHLSAKDLLPPMPEMSDLLNLEDRDDEEDMSNRQESITRSFRDVLGGAQHDEDNSVDYKAFAKDLGASLDWDVQRGFLVIGSDHEHEDDEDDDDETKGQEGKEKQGEGNGKGKAKEDGSNEAPTKLTLFVPAPEMGDMMEAEDRFYDAPLAEAATVFTPSTVQSSKSNGQDQGGTSDSNARDLTQAEATKAALRVLRNHRIAQEAAALATSRRLGKKPSPSQRVGSPHLQNQKPLSHSRSNSKYYRETRLNTGDASTFDSNNQMETDVEEEQDYSKEVMDTTTTADKIRGTDFYQLEFSLSGAKVRNVAELAKLLGVVRNKKE